MKQSIGPKKTLSLSQQRPPLRVGIVLAERFTLSASAMFVDRLRVAADEGDRSRPMRAQWSITPARHGAISASMATR